jgi:hypothetical protein
MASTPLLLLALAAAGHSNTESTATLRRTGTGFELSLEVETYRILQTVGADREDGSPVFEGDVEEYAEDILLYLGESYFLLHDGERWPLEPLGVTGVWSFDPMLGVERIRAVEARFALPPVPGDFTLTVEQDFFAETEPLHSHRLRVVQDGEEQEFAVMPGTEVDLRIEDPTPAGTRRRCGSYFRRGARFAAFGSPYLLWLLVAWNGVRRRARGWTIAGSYFGGSALTFVATLAGWLSPAPTATRAALAFSVIYVAAENLLTKERRLRATSAFLFGLVQGLGLASHLTVTGTPRLARAWCAASYLAAPALVLALAGLVILPVLVRRSRREVERRGAEVAMSVIAAGLGVLSWFTLIV